MAKQKNASTFLGGNLGLITIGEHCYAYSGDISVSGSLTQMLKFATGSKYIIARFEYHGAIAQIANNQVALEVTLNGVSVIHTFAEATYDHTLWDTPPTLLIPPRTEFSLAMSQASGADRNMQATFTGRVYDA